MSVYQPRDRGAHAPYGLGRSDPDGAPVGSASRNINGSVHDVAVLSSSVDPLMSPSARPLLAHGARRRRCYDETEGTRAHRSFT